MERLHALKGADDRAWLSAIGEGLYGPRWQRPLAQALGMSPSYVNRLASPDDVGVAVSASLRKRLADLVDAEAVKRLDDYHALALLLSEAGQRFRRPE